MALLGQNVDYTDKDFDSLRARLISLVRSAFPEWTDFNVANVGNILLESFAFVGDVLLFYQDRQASESRITTAQLRKSLLALTKLLGYEPAGASAATVELTVTLAAVPVGDVTFSAGDTFRTLEITDPAVFQVLADTVLPGGTSPPVALLQVENSRDSQEVFSATGLANQAIILADTPYIDGTASVVAANGAYTEVDNFLDSTSADRHYTLEVDENDRATITFGNGINGAIPSGSITVDYKTGGGADGNVEAGAIQRPDQSYTDSLANPVNIASVTNALPASGGADRETVEQIRFNAPESLRVLNRTVAREDYEINARKVPGVARALMLTSNERPAIEENTGHLHVIPDGGGLPTQTLKDAVYTQVTETFPNTLTFVVSVLDPEYLTVDVQATVHLARGASAATVDAAIKANLASFFALENADGSINTNVDFGANLLDVDGEQANEIAWSDVFNVVRDTAGVRKIGDTLGSFVLNGEQRDVDIEPQQFPILGSVVLLNGDTGGTLA